MELQYFRQKTTTFSVSSKEKTRQVRPISNFIFFGDVFKEKIFDPALYGNIQENLYSGIFYAVPLFGNIWVRENPYCGRFYAVSNTSFV